MLFNSVFLYYGLMLGFVVGGLFLIKIGFYVVMIVVVMVLLVVVLIVNVFSYYLD